MTIAPANTVLDRTVLTPVEPAHVGDPFAGLGLRQGFGRGRTIVFEDDPADHCYRILSGVVVVYRLLADGRRQITDFLVADDLLALGDGATYALSAEAVTEVAVERYRRRDIEAASRTSTPLACWLLAAVTRSLTSAQGQIVLLGTKTALEKVASFLLLLADRQRCGDGEAVRLPMRRKDIGDYLGLSLETVSRTFTILRNAGAIGLPHPDEVVFLDREALEEMADAGA